MNTENETPAITLHWTVESKHTYKFDLSSSFDRDRFINWFRLPEDATDERIAAALAAVRRTPGDFAQDLEELAATDPHTWHDAMLGDDWDFELHGIEEP